jgi:hypothetical protein
MDGEFGASAEQQQLWDPAGGCFADSETMEHAACMQ